MRFELLRRCALAVGAMDTVTGLFLIAVPQWTLRLMLIDQVPEQLVFVRWVGVFVAGVGLLYFLPELRYRGALRELAYDMVLTATAMIRLMVMAFVTTAILVGMLEPAWITVAITDGILGLAQLWIIKRRPSHA